MAHVVEADARRRQRVGRGEGDAAAALGAHRADMGLEAVAIGERLAVVADREREKVKLEVRPGDAGAAADEAAAFEMIAGAEAMTGEQPAGADQRLRDWVDVRIERDRLAARDLEVEFQMVLQVPADTGAVGEDGEAERLEFGGGADAGQLQELRRVDGAAGENYLAAAEGEMLTTAAAVADAGGALPLEGDAEGAGIGEDVQIVARTCG